MKSIQSQIAENLKNIRKLRGYSYDQLAQITGVSKGMLSQIEKGESSPTVNTLWKIANGLQVSFSSLVEEKEPTVSVVRLSEKTAVTENNELLQVYPYFPFDSSKKFEIYFMEIMPGCVHTSDRHHGSVEEYVLVCDGEATVVIQGVEYVMKKGDSMKFEATQTHTYANFTDRKTSCYLLIYYA
ncbi:transcriptional regulator with XRE-family HTH domain [Metabacillus crassostreae]|uniref:helix-turn-helix domain-containing protein n=1 Tax=Metabacillus crassostreae TaxID=929098 RepID=UPI0019563B8A|nr:XRE family transcriptional regulator [Metabacillus crassostreae]MBM7604164.1 transcriptional regulator with XRE-family HTH domain [Metabacillus crassostreae]